MKLANIFSAFDGMSCGQIALNRLGIQYENYFTSEIDKYAIKVTQSNYPNTIQLGDIRNINIESLPKIDLLLGGSPCQGFSFAGKQLNFNDDRSKLFFEFVRLLKELKPKYFLLENVVMKKEYQNIITKYLGVPPIMINSSLVSAQNRKRLYWTNIKNVSQPKDKGIILQDILEDNIPCNISLNNKCIPKEITSKYIDPYNKKCINGEKSTTLRTNNSNGNMWVGVDLVFSSNGLCHFGNADIKGNNEYIKRVYHPAGKSPTLTTMQGGNRQSKIVFLKGIGNQESEKSRDFRQGYRIYSTIGKSATLTATAKGKGGFSELYGNEIDNKISYRKLTPLECERLQTVPDNYTNQGVSNFQRYKMLGNGWTVDIIVHILSFIFKQEQLKESGFQFNIFK